MNSEEKLKEGPFRVPDNYFEEVNRKILASTSNSEKGKKFAFPFRPLLGAAAAIAALVTILFVTGNIFRRDEVLPELSEIILSDPSLYADELDITLVENTYISTGFSFESGLSNNELIDYLLAEELDEILIFEKIKF